jgi:hypothetical protein
MHDNIYTNTCTALVVCIYTETHMYNIDTNICTSNVVRACGGTPRSLPFPPPHPLSLNCENCQELSVWMRTANSNMQPFRTPWTRTGVHARASRRKHARLHSCAVKMVEGSEQGREGQGPAQRGPPAGKLPVGHAHCLMRERPALWNDRTGAAGRGSGGHSHRRERPDL